jgi:crotonobetainyl-CoA:carnitine CoA-transferase CaiB-like acyl-CoA transferase
VGDAPTRRYYRAADGWLAVVTDSDRLPALLSWSGASAGDAPTQAITAAMSTRRAADVIAELRGLGIAAARVVEREELATDAHLVAHHLRHVVHDAEIGRCMVVNQVAEWSRSVPVETTSVPPRETDLAVMPPPTAPR